MISSRSDIVIQSVCSFMCSSFFSFSGLGVYSAFYLVLEGCLKFIRCFKEVLRVFQGRFKGVYRKLHGWLKEI